MLKKYEILTIDNQNIEYVLLGSAKPVIIFMNGHAMPMSNWDRLLPKIEAYGTILFYNRTGVEGSSDAIEPQNGKVVIETLEKILDALELKPPYVLVGHSLGGLYANLYARLYPQNLLGMVLVEASHPDEVGEEHEPKSMLFNFVDRFLNLFSTPLKNKQNSEHRAIDETVSQVKDAGDFPRIPLTVISGMKKLPFVPKTFFIKHQALQASLAHMSVDAKHIWAKKSSHFPQLSEPEIVLEALNDFRID